MAQQRKIVVLVSMPPEHQQRLQACAPGFSFTFATPNTVTEAQLCDAEVVMGGLRPHHLPMAKALRWLQLSTAGADHILNAGTLGEDVPLTNITGAFGQAISEHMLASWLMLYKNLHLYRDNMASHAWMDRGQADTPVGKTVLVLGLGDIGGSFARLCKALGCYVIGLRRTDTRKPDYVDELYLSDALDDLLPRADVVAMALPGTKETRKIIDAPQFARMKRGAILLNVGRGNAVDGEALNTALQDGTLRAAAVDVTDPEPLPADSPLWQRENLLITPHISGLFHLEQTYLNTVDIFCDNLTRYVAGQPLRNLVDRETGYRKL